MNQVIIECRGGVVQEITILGKDTTAYVVDWDEMEAQSHAKNLVPENVRHGFASLAPETQLLIRHLKTRSKPI